MARTVGVCLCAMGLVLSVLAGVSGAQVSCPVAADTSTVLSSGCLPDANLRAAIERALGKSSGADITVGELAGLTELWASDAGISDATGIEYATGLTILNLMDNEITRIDVSKNVNLTGLSLRNNELAPYDHDDDPATDPVFPITGLDRLTRLKWLDLGDNGLTSIDVSDNTNLNVLLVNANELTEIDVSGLSKLDSLSLGGNELTSLDVSDLTSLRYLYLSRNRLTQITGLSNLSKLEILDVQSNRLTSFDFDGLDSLRWVAWCANPIQAGNVHNRPSTVTAQFCGGGL